MRNPHLESMDEDFFLHLGISSKADLEGRPLSHLFKDIKVVLMSGSPGRAEKFAKALGDKDPKAVCVEERYRVYKVGKVLSVSHGIGGPSLSILLHELTKVLHYAGAKGFCFVRTGTCGGIGVDIGTLVVSNAVYNGAVEPWLDQIACGKRVKRSTEGCFDEGLITTLAAAGKALGFPVEVGGTVCCDDYYEAQARMDGVICDYSQEDRDAFVRSCHDKGVRNMEMEGLMLGAFCRATGIPCVMVAVAFIDRLQGDQVRAEITEEQVAEYAGRLEKIAIEFIKIYGQ